MYAIFASLVSCSGPPPREDEPAAPDRVEALGGGAEPGDSGPVEDQEPAPIDGAAVLFADGTVHDVAITLDDANRAALELEATRVVHATIVIDDERIANVGIRRKGSSTLRNLDGKAAFLVDLGQWVEGQSFHGVRRFALNNMVFDESMLREHVASWLYARMRVPAYRHGYARVTVDGAAFGLYGLVEAMDQRFIDRQWGYDADGWLYDSTWNLADLTPVGAPWFEVQEEGEGVAFADLDALVDEVSAATPETALELLRAEFDAEELLRGQATEIVGGNYDSYWFNRNNYLLYHQPRYDRWHLVPWGQDQMFTGGSGLYGPFNGVLVSLCGAGAACNTALQEQMRVTARTMIEADVAGYARATWALIEADCRADPRAEQPCDPTMLFTWLEERPSYVLDQLGAGASSTPE